MKTLPAIALFLTLADSPALHAVTAAWRLPLDLGYSDIRKSESVHRLEKPPAESGFFHPGDELWDLCGSGLASSYPAGADGLADATKKVSWQGDWLVWNQTTGRVVASGAWMDLLAMEQTLGFDKAPRQVRTSFRLVTDAGERRVEAVTSAPDSPGCLTVDTLQISYRATAWRSGGDLNIDAVWPSDQPDKDWSVRASLICDNTCEQEVAHKLQGPDAWRLYATTRSEMLDGTLVEEARQKEEQGTIANWPDAHTYRELKPGLWFDISYEREDLFSKSAGGAGDLQRTIRDYPTIQPPEALREVVRNPVVDLRKPLVALYPEMDQPDFFAGYDIATSRLILAGDDRVTILADACNGACIDPNGPAVWAETNEESGGWGLSVLCGFQGSIELRTRVKEEPETGDEEERKEPDKKEEEEEPEPDLQFALEPTDEQGTIDLRYGLNFLRGGVNRGWLTGPVVLVPGHAVKLASFPASEAATPGEAAAEIPVEISVRARPVSYIPQ